MYKCSKPLSYREPVLDPLWQQIMVEKLYALPNDSCPIGVSADSCPAGAPWMRE